MLHRRGRSDLRILPGMSASGVHWRVDLTGADNLTYPDGRPHVRDRDAAVRYSTGARTTFAGAEVTALTTPEDAADLIASALPGAAPSDGGTEYATWYDGLLRLVGQYGTLPVAYADHFDDDQGWEVGWGTGIRYPHPPGGAA